MGKTEEAMSSVPSQQMPAMVSTTQAIEDGSKKIRKPYTITKSRENWTEQEHDKFLEALQLFDRDWKKIEAYVGTKTVIQIRSHAQKYFIKVQKNGTGEHVPPPRPKRKSTQPYPQKATTKTGTPAAEPPTVPVIEPNFVHSNQNATFGSVNVETAGNSMPEWLHHSVHPPGALSYPPRGVNEEPIKSESLKKSEGLPSTSTTSSPSNPRTGNLRATPNFAEVYKFIGGVFDPSCAGHLKKLKSMAPIDRETILLLIRNLTMNLSSPDFEEHRLFLTVYDGNLDVGAPNSTFVETRCHMSVTPSISSSSFSPLSSTVSALHNSSTEHSLSGWFNPHPVSC